MISSAIRLVVRLLLAAGTATAQVTFERISNAAQEPENRHHGGHGPATDLAADGDPSQEIIRFGVQRVEIPVGSSPFAFALEE